MGGISESERISRKDFRPILSERTEIPHRREVAVRSFVVVMPIGLEGRARRAGAP